MVGFLLLNLKGGIIIMEKDEIYEVTEDVINECLECLD